MFTMCSSLEIDPGERLGTADEGRSGRAQLTYGRRSRWRLGGFWAEGTTHRREVRSTEQTSKSRIGAETDLKDWGLYTLSVDCSMKLRRRQRHSDTCMDFVLLLWYLCICFCGGFVPATVPSVSWWLLVFCLPTVSTLVYQTCCQISSQCTFLMLVICAIHIPTGHVQFVIWWK